LFFVTDSNTNESGIFTLELELELEWVAAAKVSSAPQHL